MLTPEENTRLTLVGPGTPMGNVLRRYWQPALLSEEVPEPDGAPVRVRLLGEDLIAFRDSTGNAGLVEAFCPHRRAPMFFGRNEEGGLRCVYHGWKFDRDGTCVDMPSEPPDSLFKAKVRIGAYPVHESGGILWAYLGPAEMQPEPPAFEFTRAPATHRHTSKTFQRCNWLQALEGGIDSSHASFLHNNAIGDDSILLAQDTAPQFEIERTPYGLRFAGLRSIRSGRYVRVYHYVMPAFQLRGGVTDWSGGIKPIPSLHGHIWVPIDDTTCWAYNLFYSYDTAIALPHDHVEDAERVSGRGPEDYVPGTYRLKRDTSNDYLIDRGLQKTKTFTGIKGINTQDLAIQEGMGPITDRPGEHLGTSDRVIIAARQLLSEAATAVEHGEAPRGADPAASRTLRPVDLEIPGDARWQDYLRDELVARF